MEFKQIVSEVDRVLEKLNNVKNREEEKRIRKTEWQPLSKKAIDSVLQEVKNIIAGDYKKMVEGAEILGKCLNENDLTTSQIRNIFGKIKEMEMRGYDEKDTKKKLLLLKPKLAYAAGKSGAKQGTKELKDILTLAIDEVLESGITEEKFDNFCKFFEAILAYHRAAGGK